MLLKKAYTILMHCLKYMFIIFALFFINHKVYSQTCSALGQKPSTAFPVCGVDTFTQSTVPICENGAMPVPGCSGGTIIYTDKNPFWYQFTCYQTGTFGFLITPNDIGDDYDWQIFDITGRNPDDVYTDASLFVVGNWAGTFGLTGSSSSGTGNIQCASDPSGNVPTFSRWPTLLKDHTYLLMVSHFTDTQSGYQLSFGGGTASITDPNNPDLLMAEASCDGTEIRVKLNKKMKCTSLAPDGSDFEIPDQTSKIISAVGIGCSNGFDLDSVVLALDNPLPAMDYNLVIQNGLDENTLLDNCAREIPIGSSVSFTVYPKQATPLDSIVPVGCSPGVLQLSFKKNIQCSSIDKEGSDFTVTGPYPVTVSSADGVCANGLTKTINIQLSSPVVHEGDYILTLIRGTDGNTLLDECGEETPEASLSFSVKDTVSADFTYQLFEGCRTDTIKYFNYGGNGITDWSWTFDSSVNVTEQNPVEYYTAFGNKTTQLIVTNGFCTDTTVTDFYLNHDSLRAAFTGPSVYCPNDVAYFKDTSAGKIINWYWDFGNGYTSNVQNPLSQTYLPAGRDRLFPVRLIVESDKHCFDTFINYVKVVNNCYIAVPTAFTPNKDGKNDYLYPLNAYKATNLQFRVFNRYGQQVFETKEWTHKWDGTINGLEQPSGVYVWMLQYTDTDTNKKIFIKGTTVLIR